MPNNRQKPRPPRPDRTVIPVARLRLPSVVGGLFPYPPGLPVLVDPTLRVLLGTARALTSTETVSVAVLLPGEDFASHLRALDAQSSPPPSPRAHAAAAMQACGVPLRWIKEILGCTDLGTASRWARLASLPWPVLQALDRRQLTFGHLRHLIGLPPQRATDLAVRCRQNRWTVAQLQSAVAGSEPTGPTSAALGADVSSFADTLSEMLGAPVRIQWPVDPRKRSLTITFFDIEALKGVFSQLAQGPAEDEQPDTAYRRELVIPVRDAAELEALTGHLTG